MPFTLGKLWVEFCQYSRGSEVFGLCHKAAAPPTKPVQSWYCKHGFCWVILVTVFGIFSCSSAHTPAPVIALNSQPEIEQETSPEFYQVQPGDTLFAIAWYTGHDYRDLAKYNQLTPPYTIFPKQKLRLSQTKNKEIKLKTNNELYKKSPITIDQNQTHAYRIRKDVDNQTAKPNNRSQQKGNKNNTFPAKVDKWIWPVKGKVTKGFEKSEAGNKGIVIAAPRGTPVKAAAYGKVVYAGNALRGYGNLVIIKHTDTFLSAYAHNEKILVKEQQWVSVGQTIATVGSSGSDNVNARFEIRYRGKSLDPMRYLP